MPEQENAWLNEQLGNSEAAAAIKNLEDCLEKAKAGSQRRDADLEAKQRHMEALRKEMSCSKQNWRQWARQLRRSVEAFTICTM